MALFAVCALNNWLFGFDCNDERYDVGVPLRDCAYFWAYAVEADPKYCGWAREYYYQKKRDSKNKKFLIWKRIKINE